MNRHPRTNPDCPAPTRAHHGLVKAVQLLDCICDGPGNKTRTHRRPRRARTVDSSHARTTYPPMSDLERWLLERNDLPCQEVDLDLWDMDDDTDLTPAEMEFRETVARAICGSCAHREPCLTVALEKNEQWLMHAGYTPAEMRELKKAGAA